MLTLCLLRHVRACAALAGVLVGLSSFPALAQAGAIGAAAALSTGAAAPVMANPGNGAAADYAIGPGDLLSITVYRAPDIGGLVRTTGDGTAMVPGIGAIGLNGATAADASARIAAEIRKRGILLDPSVNVLVSEVRAHVVQVMGDVGRPGNVPIDAGKLTLSAVLARAGAAFGTGAGVVTAIAPDGTREHFMMADLVSGAADRPARSGEVLVVQAAAVFYISGEVNHPGAFPIEKDMTVGQALALAGGYTQRAAKGHIRITHKQAGAAATSERGTPESLLAPGDLVTVGQRVF